MLIGDIALLRPSKVLLIIDIYYPDENGFMIDALPDEFKLVDTLEMPLVPPILWKVVLLASNSPSSST